MEETVVLCGANSYNEKYYLNPVFENLPEQVKQELQIISVLHVEDVGGILTMEFDPEGNLNITVSKEDADIFFDEIDNELKIRRMLKEKEELFEGLEKYYRVFFLKQDPSSWVNEDKE